jgi:hypothetical protein
MSFDISRFTFDPRCDFFGVVMQQGRVQLDADWNEQVTLVARRIQAGTLNIIGRAVVPSTTPNAFKINVSAGTITIGTGRIYVDGLLVENRALAAQARWDPALAELSGAPVTPPGAPAVAVDFAKQPYCPQAIVPSSGGPYLVYLDVWQRPVTYLEAPHLIEPAVGVDTTGRLQTVWQVKLLDVSSVSGVTCSTPDASLPQAWQNLLQPCASRLSTSVVSSTPSGPCCLNPTTGYTGMENQLYRVEIHRSGSANASGTSSPVAATFKWSRDNASVATAVTAIRTASNAAGHLTTQLTVQNTGKDNVLCFSSGDRVELTDDYLELNPGNGPTGQLYQIDINGVDKTAQTITLQTPLRSPSSFPVDGNGATDPTRHTRIRRWDQHGKVYQSDGTTVWMDLDAPGSTGEILVPPPGTSLILENGVTVTFSLDPTGGTFNVGDYWVFAARASDGTVESLTQAPPLGIHHHYARLAVVTLPATAADCRLLLPPLTGSKGIHVIDVQVQEGPKGPLRELLNDSDVPITPFTDSGLVIRLLCDAAVDPVSVQAATCVVTVDVPQPAPNVPGQLLGFQPIILASDVTAVSNAGVDEIDVNIPAYIMQYLFTVLTNTHVPVPRLLTRLSLKGQYIWGQQDPTLYLDGEAFGIKRQETSGARTSLRLPSGDGCPGGDFDLWFWLVIPPPHITGVTFSPNPVVIGQISTGTVTLSGPAPAAGVVTLTSSSNVATNVATVPGSVPITAGQSNATFTVTTHTPAPAGVTSVTLTVTASYGGSTVQGTLTIITQVT